ncbi:MAG TPA: hypothetical protein ENJ09_14180 [Planctomycetes bacterium]|nr:hypothetical protein [Planctomycetota bacterium]
MRTRWWTSLAIALLGAGACLAPREPPPESFSADGAPAVDGGGAGGGSDEVSGDCGAEVAVEGEAIAESNEVPAPARDPAPAFLATLGRGGLDALLLRAGCAPLAGLPAQREASRRAARDEAAARIRSALASQAGGDLFHGRLRAVLAAPDGEAGELWCAAARVVGRVGLVRFAPLLAPHLGTSTERGAAAAEGLHELFGIWFSSPSDAEAAIHALEGGASASVWREALAAAEARGHRFLEGWLRADPLRAAALFGDEDPLVRARAARAHGEGLLAGKLERGPGIQALLEREEVEFDPRAHFELTLALTGVLEHGASVEPDVLRLRDHLATIHGGDRALAAARAIARLPFSLDPGDAEAAAKGMDLSSGLDLLGGLLANLTAESSYDPDPALECLFSLSALADRAEGAGLEGVVRSSRAHDTVLGLLLESRDDGAGSMDLARAAAETFASFARPGDIAHLLAILHDPATPAPVAHALLGALRRVLFASDPADPIAGEILAEVARLSGSESPDLRRRALELFADEGAAPYLAPRAPEFFDFLVERLSTETSASLRRRVLSLLARFGRPELLGRVLEAPTFDALAADPASLRDLAAACLALARGKAAATLAAARRIAGEGRVASARTRQALRLAASLAPADAKRLSPGDHVRVSEWAWRLHLAGDPLLAPIAGAEFSPEIPRSFLRALVDIHLPAAGSSPPPSPTLRPSVRAALRALALAKLALSAPAESGESEAIGSADVEAAFAEAFEIADGDRGLGALLLRDRARFRSAIGDREGALSDYRELSRTASLELPDLRRAVDLLGRADDASISPALLAELFERLVAIVEHPLWHLDPLPLRLEDLDRLVRAARRLGPPSTTRAAAILEHLRAAEPSSGALPSDALTRLGALLSEKESTSSTSGG